MYINYYLHSYLGLGLQAVRKAVLSVNQTNPDSKILESVCVNPVVSREWTYGGVTYTMKYVYTFNLNLQSVFVKYHFFVFCRGVQTGKFEKIQYNGFAR
jgi:hypothetical protein